jgi:hypothetical protein
MVSEAALQGKAAGRGIKAANKRFRRLGVCHAATILPAPLRLLQDLATQRSAGTRAIAAGPPLLERRNAFRKNSAPARSPLSKIAAAGRLNAVVDTTADVIKSHVPPPTCPVQLRLHVHTGGSQPAAKLISVNGTISTLAGRRLSIGGTWPLNSASGTFTDDVCRSSHVGRRRWTFPVPPRVRYGGRRRSLQLRRVATKISVSKSEPCLVIVHPPQHSGRFAMFTGRYLCYVPAE